MTASFGKLMVFQILNDLNPTIKTCTNISYTSETQEIKIHNFNGFLLICFIFHFKIIDTEA